VKALFEKQMGGGSEKKVEEKEEIKGNKEGFANARKLLEQNLAGKAGKTGSS
jgi:hypothetical protein